MARKQAPTPPPHLPVLGPATIDPGIIETFPYEYAGRRIAVEIDTGEFTAVCPWSGLPDFGTVRIHYLPRRRILELRSLKFYLTAYRNVGIYQEHAVNRMLVDLVAATQPRWMEITLDYRIRGGIHTVCRVSHGKPPAG